MSALDDLGVAAFRKVRAQAELAAANQALACALAGIHKTGTPKCQVGPIARDNLTRHGFEDIQIARLGLSDANVRVILRKALEE